MESGVEYAGKTPPETPEQTLNVSLLYRHASGLFARASRTQISLNTLAAMGLVEKSGTTHENTELSRTFLVRESRTHLGEYLTFTAEFIQATMPDLVQTLKTGVSKKATELFNQLTTGYTRTLASTVFELPDVAPIARGFIKKFSLEQCIHVMEDDYQTDDLGSGYDLIFSVMTLNCYRRNLDPTHHPETITPLT